MDTYVPGMNALEDAKHYAQSANDGSVPSTPQQEGETLPANTNGITPQLQYVTMEASL